MSASRCGKLSPCADPVDAGLRDVVERRVGRRGDRVAGAGPFEVLAGVRADLPLRELEPGRLRVGSADHRVEVGASEHARLVGRVPLGLRVVLRQLAGLAEVLGVVDVRGLVGHVQRRDDQAPGERVERRQQRDQQPGAAGAARRATMGAGTGAISVELIRAPRGARARQRRRRPGSRAGCRAAARRSRAAQPRTTLRRSVTAPRFAHHERSPLGSYVTRIRPGCGVVSTVAFSSGL